MENNKLNYEKVNKVLMEILENKYNVKIIPKVIPKSTKDKQ